MENLIKRLLDNDLAEKHRTYEQTGTVCGNCEKISGTAGIDVNGFYIYPQENRIEIVTENNVHYGNAHLGEDGLLYDNSNRSVFKIVK